MSAKKKTVAAPKKTTTKKTTAKKAPVAPKTVKGSKKAASAGTRGGSRRSKAAAFEKFDASLFDQLLDQAVRVREHAYAPFSAYRVGAAIATANGTIHVGCNVENSTLGATICAERGAIMHMIASGETKPVACVVVTDDGAAPCGVCRQVLAEFADDMPIVLANLGEESGRVVQLSQLLPLAFRLAH